MDLNRNTLHTTEQWDAVHARTPDFAGYESLRDFLAPGRQAAAGCLPFYPFTTTDRCRPAQDHALTPLGLALHFVRGLLLLAQHGFGTLKRAIVTG